MALRTKRRGPSPAALQSAVGYALLATLSCALALAFRDGLPWEHPAPWIQMDPLEALLTSTLSGMILSALLVLTSRLASAHFASARRLEDDLRPFAKALSPGEILVLAGLSSLGEELLFRGLLTPWLGVFLSSVLFGLLHQIRGKSRWVWVAWASVVGMLFGALFAATGSLVGPLIAHAVVNAVNLAHLRSEESQPRAAR